MPEPSSRPVRSASAVRTDPRRGALSALPPAGARALAFVAILVGGACGGLVGWGFVEIQCSGDCDTWAAFGALIGSVGFAIGTAVVSVLALRAMGEWRQLGEDEKVARAVRPRRS